MVRRIISIDAEKCNGCGACAKACHEGAIGMKNGKAVLLREDYCDGLGDCLPACPTNAISFETREAKAYDAEAVAAAQKEKGGPTSFHCPGQMPRTIEQKQTVKSPGDFSSQLAQWPVQLQLVPTHAPYFDQADRLIAADCTAYACGNFHQEFMRERITLIGCTKLDPISYEEKLTEIFCSHDIQSVIVTRMEVPCCGGMERAVTNAIANSGKNIPCKVYILPIWSNAAH